MQNKMSPSELQIGDQIRIIELPGVGIPGYVLHANTKRVFEKLISRGRAVRISRVDEAGSRWYSCRFRGKNGTWEFHALDASELDHNWVKVIPRHKKP